jgi:hypothetical protein
MRGAAFVVVGLVVAVGGCVSPQEGVGFTGSSPTRDERALVKYIVTNSVRDPFSIRNAQITDKSFGKYGFGYCISINGKNAFGAYTGQKQYEVQFSYAGRGSMREGSWDCMDQRHKWYPFPELEAL